MITCSIISCDPQKEPSSYHIIPVESSVGDYHILNLSDYATNIRYIPLETDDSILMGEIEEMISYEHEKIVISDAYHHCFLFDHNGTFCHQIGSKGRGPNEYLLVVRMSMHNDLIFITDRYKLLIYDINGVAVDDIGLRSSDFPREYQIRHILPLKKDLFVIDVVTWDNEYYPKAVLCESHQSHAKLIKEYPSYIKLDKSNSGFSFNETAIMYRFKDEIRTYKPINCDTLFTIGQDAEMDVAFIFDLGKYKPTLSFFEHNQTGTYIVPVNIFESLNHLFIEFWFTPNHAPEPFTYMYSYTGSSWERTNNSVYGVFHKSTGKLILMQQPIKGKLGFKNDFDNGPVLWPHYISSNNELVTHMSAEDFLDYVDKMEKPTPQMIELSNRISVDDNPIVIIAKLKE